MEKKSISFGDLRTFVNQAAPEDIRTLNELIKLRWASIQLEAASHLIEGDTVSFSGGRKRGISLGKIEGVVTGFAGRGPRRRVVVEPKVGPVWRVSPSLCTLVSRPSTKKF